MESKYNLVVKNLELKYPKNGFHLKPINFVLPKGAVVGLIGENGSGKTTTMHLILNLRKKTAGVVKIFDQEFLVDDIRLKEKLGVAFDDIVLPVTLSAKDVSRLYQSLYKNWTESYFIDMLAKFGVDANKRITEYSKGMQKLFSIILSMAHQPDLLIFDEPTSALDPVHRVEILQILRKFISDGEKSILFSSHITTDIEQIADYVLYINKGKLIFFEPKSSLQKEYKILRCSAETFNSDVSNAKGMIAFQKEDSEYVVLLKTNEQEQEEILNATVEIEAASLEKIMNIVSRGECA